MRTTMTTGEMLEENLPNVNVDVDDVTRLKGSKSAIFFKKQASLFLSQQGHFLTYMLCINDPI
jgi:hypothetical protein